MSATIVVEAIKPLFLEYQAAGVDFHQTPRTEPWGARTFIVGDIDGNLIAFATSAGSSGCSQNRSAARRRRSHWN